MTEAQSNDEGNPYKGTENSTSSGGGDDSANTGSTEPPQPTDHERLQAQVRRLEALQEGASDAERLRVQSLILAIHNRINALLSRDRVTYGHEVVEPDRDGDAPIPIYRNRKSGVREFAMADKSFAEFKRAVPKVVNALGSGYHDEIASLLETELDTDEQVRQNTAARDGTEQQTSEAANETEGASESTTVVSGDEPPDGELPPDEEDTPEGQNIEREDTEEEADTATSEGEAGWGTWWEKTYASKVLKYWKNRFSRTNEDGSNENYKTLWLRKVPFGYKKGESFSKYSWRFKETAKGGWEWTHDNILERINIFSDKFILKFW